MVPAHNGRVVMIPTHNGSGGGGAVTNLRLALLMHEHT